MEHNMTQEYARVSVEMPENEDKKSLRHALPSGADIRD